LALSFIPITYVLKYLLFLPQNHKQNNKSYDTYTATPPAASDEFT